jgi:hypothetical protein
MNAAQSNRIALADKISRLQAKKDPRPSLGLPPGPNDTCNAHWAAWEQRVQAYHDWEKDTPAQARARAKYLASFL